MNQKKPLFLYHVRKEEVLGMNFTGIINLVKSVDKLGKIGHQTVVITFDGFDDDPQEVWEIKPIRKWVKRLFHKVPHFLYYLNREMDAHIILLPCLLDHESMFAGTKPSNAEVAKMYMTNPSSVPRVDIRMIITEADFKKYATAIVDHGKKMNDIERAILTVGIFEEITNWS